MQRIITATWTSTGIDQNGNTVPKLKWDADQYPDFVEWLLTVFKVDITNYIKRTAAIQSLPLTVGMRPATSLDPEDTSYVVIYTINSDLTADEVDLTATALKAELLDRTESAKIKGFYLAIDDRVE